MLCNIITIRTLNPRFSFRVVGVIVIVYAIIMSGCSRLQLMHRESGETTQTRKAGDTFLSTLEKAILGERPSNDRRWRPDLRVLATADFEGDRVHIRNIRNCRYRTEEDYDVRHYDLDFKLDDVQSVDFVIVPFSNMPLIAHTMLSFGLRNGQYFSISVEGRLEQGENYSATNGTSNEFELIYLIGDERDLIPLRTEVRKVDVFIYPGRASPERIQLLLVDMLDRANKLAAKPEFYHTLTNNCTTNLVDHVNTLRPGAIPRDWRVLFPGHSDKMLFDLGLLETTGSFQAAKLRARVNNRAILFKNDANFSKLIRENL
jgi:hypothetical protein